MALSRLLRKMGRHLLPTTGGLPAIAAAVAPRSETSSFTQLGCELAPSSATGVVRSSATRHGVTLAGVLAPPAAGLTPPSAAGIIWSPATRPGFDLAPPSAAGVFWSSTTRSGFTLARGVVPPAAGLAPPSAAARSAMLATGAGSGSFQERLLARAAAATDIFAAHVLGFLAQGAADADILATRMTYGSVRGSLTRCRPRG